MSVLLFGSVAIVAGAVYGYVDATTGTAGTAHITYCETVHPSARQTSVDCKGRWRVGGRTVTGWVDNADYHDLGKDISVRIHGGRATEKQLWIPLVLFALGLPATIFCIWFMRRIPARFPATPRTG